MRFLKRVPVPIVLGRSFFSSETLCSSRIGGWISLLILSGSCLSAVAQGTLQIALKTGDAGRVQQRIVDLGRSSSDAASRVEFKFGFASAEPIGPGFVMDSFSVGLLDAQSGLSAVVLLMDVNGLFIAPRTEGTVFLERIRINIASIPTPPLQPELTHRQSFRLSMPIPEELQGRPLLLLATLYDNQDDGSSLAWVDDLVVVPEPPLWGLLGLLLLLCRLGSGRMWWRITLYGQVHPSGDGGPSALPNFSSYAVPEA